MLLLIAPNLVMGIFYYIFKLFMRFLDRGGSKSLSKVTDTKQVNQSNSDLVNSSL